MGSCVGSAITGLLQEELMKPGIFQAPSSCTQAWRSRSGLRSLLRNCWVLILAKLLKKENIYRCSAISQYILVIGKLGDLVQVGCFICSLDENHFSCVFNILEEYFPRQTLRGRQQIHSEATGSLFCSPGDSEQAFECLLSPASLRRN